MGDYLKNILKVIFLFLVLIITVFGIMLLNDNNNDYNISYAASPNTSDIQLMARAINGEARGEPYGWRRDSAEHNSQCRYHAGETCAWHGSHA